MLLAVNNTFKRWGMRDHHRRVSVTTADFQILQLTVEDYYLDEDI